MLLVIVKKELKRVFTDKRLVFSSFVLPALSIFLLYSLMGNMIGNMSNEIDEHIALVTIVNSPESFKDYIELYIDQIDRLKKEQGADFNDFQLEARYIDMTENEITNIKNSETGDLVKLGKTDVVIIFDQSFDKSVEGYETIQHPNVNTFYNPGEEYSSSAISRIEYQLLTGYQNFLLEKRFDGLSTLSAFTVNIENQNNIIAKEGQAAGLGMSFMMPMLLNIMLFAGAMGIGIDVIAGEKERGTMATLLLTPVDRKTIAFGKVLSLGIVAVISATCTFGAIIASLPNASEMLAGGTEVSIDSFGFAIGDYLMLLTVIIMQVGIFVGLICLISVIAKSVKEAGTYISPIYMVVMISAFGTIFTTQDVQMYKFMIPIMGNVFAIKEILTFDLSLVEFGVTVGMSAVIIGVLLKLITMAFNNERTMFNT